ncbi:MAG: hypothetical protein IT385_19180 [Deltaproteobacteria bacterium]|nr:hypothetical protein [Deltaproteobacteria bacterium]
MSRVHALALSFVALVGLTGTARAGAADPFTYRETGRMCLIPTATERLGADDRDGAFSLYLFASGNFAVSYEEHTPSCAGGECRYDVPTRFWVEGRWSEAGGVISLPGFGAATIDGTVLRVSVSDSRVAPSARGHVFVARVVGSSAVAYTLGRQMDYYGFKTTLPEIRDAVYPQ